MRSSKNNRPYNHRRDRQSQQQGKKELQNDKKWAEFYQSLKKSMTGSQEEKETTLRRRILKNFQNYNLESHLFYIERRDLDPNSIDLSVISQSSLLIYGIDFMPEISIKNYFNPFEVEIYVYDDSHCEIRYKNSLHLMQSFYSKLIEKPMSLNAFYSQFKANYGEMVRWRQIVGYSQMMIHRTLWARFATKYDLDQKREKSARTMMETFEAAKSQFMSRQEKIKKKGEIQPFGRIRDRDHSKQTIKKPRQISKTCCCISSKMNKLMQFLMCSCPQHSANKMKRCSPKIRDRSPSYQRQRSRDNKYKESRKKNTQLKALKDLSTPLPIIQQITNSSVPEAHRSLKIGDGSEQLQMKLDLSIPAIPNKEDLENSKDILFLDMLKQFSRYSPFSDLNESKKISNNNDSHTLYSYYETDNHDEQ